MILQLRGEAGDVTDELLLGGNIDLVCTVEEPRKNVNLRVIYVPASGELAGRECTLAPTFIEDFLQQPRCPRRDEYQLLPPSAYIIDLACASGNLPMATNSLLDSDSSRLSRAEIPTTPQAPQKRGRLGVARALCKCGMRCGMSSMGKRVAHATLALAQAANVVQSMDPEKAGQGGLKEA